jgi:hypothetical protein
MYDSSQPSHSSEGKSHPKGSVLAPMAGLIVKVLLEDGGGRPACHGYGSNEDGGSIHSGYFLSFEQLIEY